MSDIATAINRFGLGARPEDSPPADPRRWLIEQLGRFDPAPQPLRTVPARAEIAADLQEFLATARSADRMARVAMPMQPASMADSDQPGSELPDYARQYLRREVRDNYLVMNAARLGAALTTPTPFAERLVHFWANHFAVSADKLPVIGFAGLLEFEAVRPNLMGRFADMLIAVEQHPAMLLYLDQAQSIGPESRASRFLAGRGRQQRGLNENLAREILELHTLGVNGGYGQSDVTELARALTGWTVSGVTRGRAARLLGSTGQPGSFHFASAIHQPGDRTVLGRRYPQSGEGQARAILDTLAANPATARHISTKLARHFAGDDPPPAMVERLTRTWLGSGGDLPTVYRAIVDSPEAWVRQPVKFKAPWEWTVSALRALGLRDLDGRLATGLLAQLGQPTWQPGSPAGWDDIAASWAGPEALVRRVEAAERIAERAASTVDARELAERLFPGRLGMATRTAIARAESPAQGLALLLVSPEFLRR